MNKTLEKGIIKLNLLQPHDPVIVLLGMHTNESTTYIHTKICTRIFIVALSIYVKVLH